MVARPAHELIITHGEEERNYFFPFYFFPAAPVPRRVLVTRCVELT